MHHRCNMLRNYEQRLDKYMPKEEIKSCSEQTYGVKVHYSGNKEFRNHALLSTPILSQMPGKFPEYKVIEEKKQNVNTRNEMKVEPACTHAHEHSNTY